MSLSFDHPWYLALLALAPLVWLLSFRSLSGLGRLRRMIALAVRSGVLVLIILALAQVQSVWTSPRLTVLYLLDQSLSIPAPQRQMMSEFVKESVAQHRDAKRQDRAGVIVFAKDAAVEYPPIDENIQPTDKLETPLDVSHTNLEDALKLAAATLPADSASRVVLVTDGNENLGDSYAQAQQLAEKGIGIDVVPIHYSGRSDVAVEKLTVPPDVQAGQPFDLHVVLNNTAPESADAQPVKGRLQIFRKTRDNEQEIASEKVALPPGKKVFSMREQIDAADAYRYSARFVPDDAAADQFRQNKEATGFTQVRGQGRVLLIEDSINPGDYDVLVDRLRREKLQVAVINTDELFTSLGELQPYDTVILANVPREAFSNSQIEMLVANTQRLGAGLIMLGGPNSFGAGGWAKTALEEALPVDCEVKNLKVRPVGALALVIDRSGSMNGEKLAMAKAAAMAAINILADSDYVTVTAFDVLPRLVVPIVKKGSSQTIRSRIDALGADGGTNMRPGMEMAREQLERAGDAAMRHMVILTDGLTEGSGYQEFAEQLRQEKITVSTIGVGPDADLRLLSQMALAGGGHFYHAKTPRVLPRIFQEEARVVARPLVYERNPGFQPQIHFPHEMLKGIDAAPPPITGYVLTTVKDNPLVEVALVSPVPSDEPNNSLLASWTYGLGKVVALTTDAGRRWASQWTSWPDYDKLFSQMVRWSMRPTGDQGKFSVATDVRGDKVRVVVNALDKDDQFLNFLNPTGNVVGPDMKVQELRLHQTAPGRYVGEFDAAGNGSYFFTLLPAPGMGPIISGVDVPYSSEFLDRESNDNLLAALADLKPTDSQPGMMIEDHGQPEPSALATADVFRHNLRPATSRQDVWPQLMLWASCLFLMDVFVRRVRVDLTWISVAVHRLWNRLRHRETPAVVETIARLRSRKSAVAQTIESQKAALRFEDVPAADPSVLERAAAIAPVALQVESAAEKSAEQEPESYTARLLKAKQQAQKDLPK